ncbi:MULTISPECIES: hypothetical protein [unclassified Micromonospora]|uniref:hypothetical protein n=1 Tax=unclassified Micromonospora TaxID=2617518 RepID=UPI003320C8E7
MNRDVYLSRAEAATVAGVKPRTLEGWRNRGWSTPAGEHRELTTRPGPRGHLRYKLGDVLDAARDTAQNPKNPGREAQVLVLA